METPSRRNLYRIVYPLEERPSFEVRLSLHDVVDCSERGMRYTLNHQTIPAVGTRILGTLHFRRGESVRVHGTVLRTERAIVVLALDPPLAFAEVMAEQRYLRAKGFLGQE
ncbi:MAG TPA: hypothetical protein VGM82_02345 [Gemmatimonadaceae bacterium]|jgi:hypothetical protein